MLQERRSACSRAEAAFGAPVELRIDLGVARG